LIYQDDILYLHYADLAPDPISESAYKQGKRRGNFQVQGRGGNGREVLIAYESLPSKWKAKLADKYGDLYSYCSAQIIKPHLVYSDKDAETIKNFITSKEEHLPEEAQEAYRTACAYLTLMAMNKRAAQIKKLGFPSKGQLTDSIQRLIQAEGIKLPSNYSNLKRKLREYEENGATAVISGRWGNSNTEKITEEIEKWMVLEMCRTRLSPESVHQRYMKVAEDLGFRKDISAEAFKHRLSQPHLFQLISLKRYGKKDVRSKTGQTFKIAPPVYSNDYWQGDGSAIDLAFRNEAGKIGMATVYIVVDVLTESIIGWSINEGKNREDFQLQLKAFRHAVRTTGSKPYQLKYDKQKGHLTEEAQKFYDSLATVHFPSRAYRSSSRRVEGIFGRLQRQILAEYPFWTGFGRHTSSKLANWYDADKMNRNLHNLPNYEELCQLWEVIVNDWNAATHPNKKASRAEFYQSRKDPKVPAVELPEMVEMFFNVTKPMKYQANGITLTRKGHSTTYVVYNEKGLVDYKFREKYLKAALHVKYDPEFEYPEVELYAPTPSGDMRFVATAQPARETHDVVKYLEPGERQYIDEELQNEDDFYTHLDTKANALGYDETEVMTSWRSKIGLRPTKKKQTVDAATDTRSDEDFLLDQL
jgi:transposase InsO family protein